MIASRLGLRHSWSHTRQFSSMFACARGFKLIGGVKLYTQSHEWIQRESGSIARMGISNFAQDQLGEVVYADLPSAGSTFSQGQTICTLESVKAVGEVYTPMDSEVVEINEKLADKPNLINESPEDEGWLLKLRFEGDFDSFSKKWMETSKYQETLNH
jgi:glycine cleavage system H protein